MGRFNKAWGALIGGLIGLAAVYGFEVGENLKEAMLALPPLLSLVGTYVAPANKP